MARKKLAITSKKTLALGQRCCLLLLLFAMLANTVQAQLPNKGSPQHLGEHGQKKGKKPPIDKRRSNSAVLLRSYIAADFSHFNPRTAFDLVERVPGFSIEEERSARGFGQASSNVLINGARIAGKSNGVVKSLKRIPVSGVVRIEVYEGSSLGIAGLTGEVVDVTSTNKKIAGAWTWELQHRDQNDSVDPAYFKSSLSLSGQAGITDWSLGLDNDYQRLGHGGPEVVSFTNGNADEFRDESATFDRDRPSATLGLTFNRENGELAHLNLSYERYWQRDIELRESTVRDRRFDRTVNESSFEFSTDYEWIVGPGRLKMIALQSSRRVPEKTRRAGGSEFPPSSQETMRNNKRGESIFRTEYRFRGQRETEWQLSSELAYNYLDSSLQVDTQAMPPPIMMPPPPMRIITVTDVAERRADLNVSYGLPLSKTVQLQSSLGYEYSKIEQSGDNNRRREFTRPKGFVTLGYQLSKADNLSLRIERRVGQLKFEDFASTVDVLTSNASAGNTELVPEQLWQFELKLDHKFSSASAVNVQLFAEEIDDLVDRILVNGQNALGNIDSAKRYGIDFSLLYTLDGIGWTGAQLKFAGRLQKSEVEDPITGATRRISDDLVHRFITEFRHDLTRGHLAWGVDYTVEQRSDSFFVDRVVSTSQNEGILVPFVEHKNILGINVRFSVRNYNDRLDSEVGQFFDPGTRADEVQRIESRERDFGRTYKLEFSGTF